MASVMATFTIYWCCIAAAYVVTLGLFKLATKEASDRDFGLLQVRRCVCAGVRLSAAEEKQWRQPRVLLLQRCLGHLTYITYYRCVFCDGRGPKPVSVSQSHGQPMCQLLSLRDLRTPSVSALCTFYQHFCCCTRYSTSANMIPGTKYHMIRSTYVPGRWDETHTDCCTQISCSKQQHVIRTGKRPRG